MSLPPPSVRVLVLGDAQVGKTSLIASLLSQRFTPQVPALLTQVCISPENTVDNTALYIQDTIAEQDTLDLLKTTDAVVVVHALNEPKTFDRMISFWLPELADKFDGPVIVCGNKLDIASDQPSSLEDRVRPLIEKFAKVEYCLEVSAKDPIKVADLFYSAQHAALHPAFRLFNSKSKSLTPAFETALTRVFRHYDQDHDSLWSDIELNNFQEDCFGARLPPGDLEGFKNVLAKEAQGYVIESSGVTLEGIQFLFKLFIQRNRPESSWQVLHKFGYNSRLELQTPSMPVLDRDQSAELTKKLIDFLTQVFTQFDSDADGALSPIELARIFAVLPSGECPPWEGVLTDFPDGCLTNRSDHLTLAGWLGMWHLVTALKPEESWRAVKVLGFPGDWLGAFKPTKKRSKEKTDTKIHRQVIRGLVLGDDDVGKSTFLSSLVRKLPRNSKVKHGRSTIAAVKVVGNSERGTWLLLSDNCDLDQCDVVVLLFDANREVTVNFIRQCLGTIPSHVPCVVLGSKADLPRDKNTVKAAKELTDFYSLAEPELVTLKGLFQNLNEMLTCAPPSAPPSGQGKWQQDMDRLFEVILTSALFPKAARPMTQELMRSQRRLRLLTALGRVAVVLSVVTLGVVGAGYLRRSLGGGKKGPMMIKIF